MKIEWTPFMRDLQKRIAAGRVYLAAHPESDDALRRIRALGLWLAEEVVAYRMEVGTQVYMALPVEQKQLAEVRIWAQAQSRANTRKFPGIQSATLDGIFDRIWNVLGKRQDRYIAMIAQIDPSIAAERDREQERRYRESFGDDAAYADALHYERSFARERYYAQGMLTATPCEVA